MRKFSPVLSTAFNITTFSTHVTGNGSRAAWLNSASRAVRRILTWASKADLMRPMPSLHRTTFPLHLSLHMTFCVIIEYPKWKNNIHHSNPSLLKLSPSSVSNTLAVPVLATSNSVFAFTRL